jgi:hypothetical protein
MIDFVNGMGDYWIRLVEQMVPATTIWNTGVRLENSVLHRQKFVWRRQEGCKIVPVPCKPCSLSTQLFVYDCPIQQVVCPIYPWQSNPNINSFGAVLDDTLNNFYIQNGLNSTVCDQNTVITTWYVDLRFNGVQLSQYSFYNGVGPFDVPTNQQWLNALTTYLGSLLTSGYSYNIDYTNETVTVYNNNCQPNFDDFEINVGINFEIYCNV